MMPSPQPSVSEASGLLESQSHVLSNAGALMHVVKGTVGTGILGLPWAIEHAGLIVGPIMIIFIGVVNLHCMHLLVSSSRHLAKVFKTPPLDYGETALLAVRHGPVKVLRVHAEKAKIFVNVCLEITQLGLCCTYTVFIGQNVRQVVVIYWLDAPDDRAFMAMLCIPFILVCLIKNLSLLAWFSSAANIAGVISICMMMRYILPNLPPVSSRPFNTGLSEFAVFVGASIGAFEGIPVILPIGNAMRTPEDFHIIINCGISIIIFLYVGMAFVGFLKFGSAICGSITLNLPISSPYYDTVRILYSFAVFATFPLQFYVAMEIIETAALKKFHSIKPCCSIITRIFFVVLICIFSIAVPFIGDLNSLIGATSSTMLVLVFPPLIHSMAFGARQRDTAESSDSSGILSDAEKLTTGNDSDEKEMSNWIMGKDLIIAALAMASFVAGLIQTVMKIIDDVQHHNSLEACSGGVVTTHYNETLDFSIYLANLSAPLSNLSAPLSNLSAPLSNLSAPLSNLSAPLSNLYAPLSNHSLT